MDEPFLVKTGDFLAKCENGGGYSLKPGTPPSAYGTRLACLIYEKFLGKSYPCFPYPEETKKFIVSLWDESKGGFRGVKL